MIARLFEAVAAFGPAGIMLAYGFLRLHGDWRNEAVWAAFGFGGMVSLLAVAAELAGRVGLSLLHLPQFLDAAAEAFGVVAWPEEGAKFAVVLLALKHIDARRMRDVALIALATGLGFAALENFFYIVGVDGWNVRAVTRAGTAIPAHALDGLTMGAFMTRARLAPRRRRLWLGLALAVPLCLHAAYDFPLIALRVDKAVWLISSWLGIVLVTAVCVMVLTARTIAAATEWDRQYRLDPATYGSTFLATAGASFVGVGALLAVAVRFAFDIPGSLWIGVAAMIAFLPVLFGFDLLRVGISERFRRKPTHSPAL